MWDRRRPVRRRRQDEPAANEGDVRQLVDGCAAAVRRLHAATNPAPAHSVVGLGVHQINRRFSVACAGLAGRRTPHSGRVGLAVELVARGATTRDVQLASGWKNPGMVARYAARGAAAGAVGRFMRLPAGGNDPFKGAPLRRRPRPSRRPRPQPGRAHPDPHRARREPC